MELTRIAAAMLLLSTMAAANIVSAELSQTSYGLGEEISLVVVISNPEPDAQNYSTTCSFAPIGQTYGLYPLRQQTTLSPGASETQTFSMHVSSLMPSGDWVAKIGLIMGDFYEGNRVDSENLSFAISGTLEPIDFSVSTCRQETCSQTSTLFYLGETVYVDYESSVTGLSVTGTMILPDDTTETITLPLAYQPTQTGTHLLNITASKEGHQSTGLEKRFGVLETEVEITPTNISAPTQTTSVDTQTGSQTAQMSPGEPGENNLPIDTNTLLAIIGVLVVLLVLAAGVIIGQKSGKKTGKKK